MAAVTIFGGSFHGPSLSAEELWSADPVVSSNVNDFFKRLDPGNYPHDFCYERGDQEGKPVSTVTTVEDPEHGLVWKVNKPKMRKRAEFARAEGQKRHYSAKDGDDIYIGWRWKISTEDGQKIDREVTVWQWKSGGKHDQNYPLNMEYDGTLTLNAFGPSYDDKYWPSQMRSVLWRKAVPQDTWVSLVVRIKIDRGDFAGITQFWFNGEQQELANLKTKFYEAKIAEDKKTVYHRTGDGAFVYPKWGIYNKKSCSYDASAYFDDMKIGTTLESVIPK